MKVKVGMKQENWIKIKVKIDTKLIIVAFAAKHIVENLLKKILTLK